MDNREELQRSHRLLIRQLYVNKTNISNGRSNSNVQYIYELCRRYRGYFRLLKGLIICFLEQVYFIGSVHFVDIIICFRHEFRSSYWHLTPYVFIADADPF